MPAEKISGAGFLNTDYYLNFECTKATGDILGIAPSPDPGKRKDLFEGAGSGDILEIDASNNKHGKTQKQNEISTQVTAKTKAVITLVETRQWKSKNIHRRVSISFPHNCPVIFQTKILADYVKTKDAILKFKGRYTWKRSPGGRYAIVDVPASIITNMITEKMAAKAAIEAKVESTTTRIEPDPV